jgi:hypothetical protein
MEHTMAYTFDENLVSDLHKDARGSRPDEYFWEEWTNIDEAGKQFIWERLLGELDVAVKEEQTREQQAIDSFEKHVVSLESISNSRKQSIRWIVEGLALTDSDKMYGGDYICYKLGLPYSYAKEFDEVLQELALFG